MTREEAFQEINKLQDEYIDELIALMNDKDHAMMQMLNFTSPTGTGKTKMMSKLINKFPDYYFIITTLSKGQLHIQIKDSLNEDCNQDNFYVYGSADYKINSKLDAEDIISKIPKNTKCIWLRDEGHIRTNRWDELLLRVCYKVINFSATNTHSDIQCNFTSTMMLRTVNQTNGTPEDAINKLLEIKEAHKNVPYYNPCAIFRCVSGDTGLYNMIVDLCEQHNLNYIDITEDEFVMKQLCEDDNKYDVIINKFKIVEGIDIRRAHVLYMDNQPGNNATTIQVIGRCRRNALLYRNDIDILAPENEQLLNQTRECYVYYNVENMKIDEDENGELQYAFCNHISCQALKPGSEIYVKDGQLPNGLYIIELAGYTGWYKIDIDLDTGFNVVNPITSFYNLSIIPSNNTYIYLKDVLDRQVAFYKIKPENFKYFKKYNTEPIFDYSTGEWKQVKCKEYYIITPKVNQNFKYTYSRQEKEDFYKIAKEYTQIINLKKLITITDPYAKFVNFIQTNIELYKDYLTTNQQKELLSLLNMTSIDRENFIQKTIIEKSEKPGFKLLCRDLQKPLNYESKDLEIFIKYLNIIYKSSNLYIPWYFSTFIKKINIIKKDLNDFYTFIYYFYILQNFNFDMNKIINDKSLECSNIELSHSMWNYFPYINIYAGTFDNIKIEFNIKEIANQIEENIIRFNNIVNNNIFITKISYEAIKEQISSVLHQFSHRIEKNEIQVVIDYSNLFLSLSDNEKYMLNKNYIKTIKNKIYIDDIYKLNQYNAYMKIKNDKESSIIGVDLMYQSKNEEGEITWKESRSVSSKIGNYNKFNTFIQNTYSKELIQAKQQYCTGKNSFILDKKCNQVLGYCVEYYSKYLVYGKEYLGHYIDDAMKESKVENENNFIIIRACMLKYKEMMCLSFGSNVSKLIKTISVNQLIKEEYKEFCRLVIELGNKVADFIKEELYKDIEPINNIDPNLSIRHISGLADYITEDTILDVKVLGGISEGEVKQVLAYHYLSTKRSDLNIKRVIVYDATSGRHVTVNIEPENWKENCKYGYKGEGNL